MCAHKFKILDQVLYKDSTGSIISRGRISDIYLGANKDGRIFYYTITNEHGEFIECAEDEIVKETKDDNCF